MSESRHIVKVSTESWFDGRNLNVKKKMAVLKRMSKNSYDPIKEECDMSGSDDARIILMPNLNIDDGIYMLTVRYYYDCESCVVDDMDYTLSEIKESTQ